MGGPVEPPSSLCSCPVPSSQCRRHGWCLAKPQTHPNVLDNAQPALTDHSHTFSLRMVLTVHSVLFFHGPAKRSPTAPTCLCLQAGSTEADSESLACREVTSGSPKARHPRKEGKESRTWQKKLSHDADP